MHAGTAIKWGHRALTLALLMIVLIGGVLWHSEHAPYDDQLISRRQLSKDIWLYVTKYNGGGATVSGVYRYYLNRQLDDPLEVIEKAGPFLQADKGDATITAIGDHVLVRLTGKVYSFSNSAFFYADKIPVTPRIDFNSVAENPWK